MDTIIIIVIILLFCCCCCCIIGGGGFYYLNFIAPKNPQNLQSSSGNTSTPSSSGNTSEPTITTSTTTTTSPPTTTQIPIPAPIVTDFRHPLGEYSSNCTPQDRTCNCRMDFKVLYEVTVNGVKLKSPPSEKFGPSDNCYVYWNPTIYFTITNPPTNISSDIKIILLTSRFNENNWYYSKVEPLTFNTDKNIRFTGETATFGPKYT